MPCHPDRVRRNYEDDPFAFLEGRLTALFTLGRGITVGWVKGKPLKVSRRYLLDHGVTYVAPQLASLVVEDE